ncbi:SIS domain-containing protein [uncultured Celeribacter sp.]|uniref:SIS domain-containing protein n=1 Tax=uncultured Celeribacter sp. TaxID=1303376 RepID=UPI002AA88454|nr:SIS domain-containing protein [uncultured Celeribacter sp.]
MTGLLKDDPRWRNVSLANGGAAEYAKNYANSLSEGLSSVNGTKLDQALQAIEACSVAGGTLYLAGNGGSAAICDHLVCDFVKGTYHVAHPPIRAISLTENVALYTAIANDFHFENVFSFQLQARMRPEDILIAVSSSGNSENIIRAVAQAQKIGAKTIGLSGFDGGRLNDMSEIPLHVAVNNYGVVEDAHSALLHIMVQMIGQKRDGVNAK